MPIHRQATVRPIKQTKHIFMWNLSQPVYGPCLVHVYLMPSIPSNVNGAHSAFKCLKIRCSINSKNVSSLFIFAYLSGVSNAGAFFQAGGLGRGGPTALF